MRCSDSQILQADSWVAAQMMNRVICELQKSDWLLLLNGIVNIVGRDYISVMLEPELKQRARFIDHQFSYYNLLIITCLLTGLSKITQLKQDQNNKWMKGEK